MKKGLLFFWTLLISMLLMVSAFAANTNADAWAQGYMNGAYAAGLITEEDMTNAKGQITRLAFCQMVMAFFEKVSGSTVTVEIANPFQDCNDQNVVAAHQLGIINGMNDTTFAPDNPLTRGQMAIMICRTLDALEISLETENGTGYTDLPEMGALVQSYVLRLQGAGIMNGYSDGSFRQNATMSVQEAVTAFYRAYTCVEALEGNTEEIPTDESTSTDENATQTPETTAPDTEKENTSGMDQNDAEDTEKEDTSDINQKNETDTDTNDTDHTAEDNGTSSTQVANGALDEGKTIYIEDKAVFLSESVETLKADWGEPTRIATTVYGLERLIYGDLEQYFFVTVSDDKVVEIFTCAKDFRYGDVAMDQIASSIKGVDNISEDGTYALIQHEDYTQARLFMDYRGEVAAIQLLESGFDSHYRPKAGVSSTLRKELAQELLEIIQSKRLENNVPLLTENSKLTNCASANSKRMAETGEISYYDKTGEGPFDRIKKWGVSFQTATEVIVGMENADVLTILRELMQNSAQMGALMSEDMTDVGIGFAGAENMLYLTIDLCGGVK